MPAAHCRIVLMAVGLRLTVNTHNSVRVQGQDYFICPWCGGGAIHDGTFLR